MKLKILKLKIMKKIQMKENRNSKHFKKII